MRIDRFICKSTELCRVKAIAALNERRVQVNGEVVVDKATQVHENNHITFDGQVLHQRPSRYLMMHKRLGTICSTVDGAYPSLLHHIHIERVFDLHFAGRLDADTTGLVLLTDDGRWSYEIITPKKQCKKRYRVGLRDPIAADIATKFELGVQLQGEKSLTLPAKLEIIAPKEALLTITEGKHHQVKRMFAAVGNRVVRLHREKIGEVCLDIEPGQWRYLTLDEVASF